MDFETYQEATEQTAIYPGQGEWVGKMYCTLALVGESGEVAEKMKKAIREGDDEYIEQAEKELGDVLWYLARLCEEMDTSLDEVADQNIEKLLDRKEREALTGQGDDR